MYLFCPFAQVARGWHGMFMDKFKLCQDWCRFDGRKTSFTENIVKHRKGLPKGVVKSLSLELFKIRGDVALMDRVYWWTWQC